MNIHSLARKMLLPLKQTEKPVDQRVTDILSAARSAFAEKGFDGASMQDLARAAGMSVGNFYRYFPSKAAIVEALIAADLADMQRDFSAVITSADPMAMLRQCAGERLTQHQCGTGGRLWAEITAAALRKPEIGLACGHMETAIAGYLTQAFAHVTGLSLADTQAKFTAHAAFIVMLVKSASMMPPQEETARNDLNALILRTIDQTLNEIAQSGAKG
jgi:AcrR family transcriptional regulator